MKMIDKDTVVAEIKRYKHKADERLKINGRTLAEDCKDYALQNLCGNLLHFLDTLEVKDPYEQCIQYPNIKDGIKAHAETYSFNIESELFNQLTKEQQKLWREEIEQACISGGDAGVTLARDQRYKENLETKEVDFKKEIEEYLSIYWPNEKDLHPFLGHMAKHFFELGLSHSVDESIVRKVIDLYFEAVKHYDEVIKQERYRTGGSQLAIDILSGSKDMKELCVQYILDKVTKL